MPIGNLEVRKSEFTYEFMYDTYLRTSTFEPRMGPCHNCENVDRVIESCILNN